MKPILPVKFGLLAIAAVFTAAFFWSAAQGQFRTPRPPVFRPPVMPNQPQINPPGMPGVGPTTTVWKCPHCGYEYRGAVPPSNCPGCKAQMSNGVGNGIPGPGGMVNPNPARPMTPPAVNMNPPVVNVNPPVVNVNPPPPNLNQPVVDPPASNLADSSSPSPAASSSSSSGITKNWKMITLVIGVIVIGVIVLLGGTFLVIYTMKSTNPKPRRRRRRRDDDDYDRD